jgi:hypothetical protein
MMARDGTLRVESRPMSISPYAVARRLLAAAAAAGCLARPAAAGAQQGHDHEAAAAADQAPADQREYPSLKIAGFGDVNFSATDKPEGAKGFTLGQFVLHMASELSPRVTFFGELSLSARGDAGTGSPAAPGFNTEVERMILRFDQSDRLKISFGRYHTPINYWNTAFHHGQWLQTTIARPEMIQFGGRFLPVHFIGALVEGSVPASGWNVGYKAGLGNGRSTVISRGGDAGDVNDNKAWLVNGFSKPDALYGLEFGASLYGDRVTVPSAGDVGERIVSAHVAWSKEDPEFIAEVASVRHERAGGGDVTWSHAYYVQAAYRLPQFNRLWKPYFRFEHIGIDDADVVFATVPRLDGATAGVRYDASPLAAIKGEVRSWTRGEGSVRNVGGFFQVCFTF